MKKYIKSSFAFNLDSNNYSDNIILDEFTCDVGYLELSYDTFTVIISGDYFGIDNSSIYYEYSIEDIDKAIEKFNFIINNNFGATYKADRASILSKIGWTVTSSEDTTFTSISGTDDNIYLHKAKRCIADYIYYEFDGEPDFGDLSHIEVAYTTEENPITGKESEIQTYVDLINFEIVTEIDGIVVNTIKYNTLNDFIDNELQWLDFDSLVRTDDEMWDVVNGR